MAEPDGHPVGDSSPEESPTGRVPAEPVDPTREPAAAEQVDGTDAPGSTSQRLDAAAVLAYLREAPPEVRAWLLQGTTDAPAGGETRPQGEGPGPAATSDADDVAPGADAAFPTPGVALRDVVDVAGDPDQEEDEDDILARSRPRGRTASRQAPRRSHTLAIVLALLAGVALGYWVWQSGRPASEATPTIAASTPSAGSTQDTAARLAELNAALAQDPADVDALLELGVVQFNSGDIESGARQWEKVVELDPTQVRAWYNLGFYHLSTDPVDMAAAQEAWEKVIALDPDSDLARTVSTHMSGLMATATPGATSGAETSADPSGGAGPSADPSAGVGASADPSAGSTSDPSAGPTSSATGAEAS